MNIECNISKLFYSYDVTYYKYDMLYSHAQNILSIKNKLSRDFNDHVLEYLDQFNAKAYVTYCRSLFPKELSSNFDCQAYEGIFNDYSKKFDQVKHNTIFKVIKFKEWVYETVKYDGVKYSQAKSVKTIKSETSLTRVLTFITRYGSPDMLIWCQEKLNNQENLSENQIKLYEDLFRLVDKFGFSRLYNLAMQRKIKILSYFKYPIIYKSSSFKGRCNKKNFIGENTNEKSIIDAFISLSIPDKDKKIQTLNIPVKYSKKYHGSLEKYIKENNVYMYTLCFDEVRKRVKIILCIEEDRTFYDLDINKDEVIGIDVNIKNNLFALSNGQTYNLNSYAQNTINEYLKLCLVEDNLRKIHDENINKFIEELEKQENKTLTKKEKQDIKNENPFKLGKHKIRIKNSMKSAIQGLENDLIAQICKDLKSQNIHHVVMEDLDQFGQSEIKMKIKKDDSEEIKQDKIKHNRLVRFVGLADLNNRFERIARKYGILVSKVQAPYTSQQCNICGHIEKDNRKTQEKFKCLECQMENNADINAAKNIKDRVSEAVLRDKLLVQNEFGSFSPNKRIKMNDLFEFLTSPAVQTLYNSRTARQ